ncbi:Conserved_hypothetical protein [Hexamita inflata]|uniref:Uncharacterized protein n=1 Tax=Hexamita inflata TaxID=28002 RepID=A0AA86NL11_9EUKA|nr:Conserved hypothetical protein [Hexamita inflata]
MDIKKLEIYNCPNIDTKLNSNSIKELIITDCVLRQINFHNILNLEVLVLNDSPNNQIIQNHQLNLQSIAESQHLKEISITGYNIDIAALQNISSLTKICLHQCTNINTELLNRTIKELVITNCNLNSIDIQRFQELVVLKLEDEHKQNVNRVVNNLDFCFRLQKITLNQSWTIDIIQEFIKQNPRFDSKYSRYSETVKLFLKEQGLNDLEEVNMHSQKQYCGELVIENQQILETLDFAQIIDIHKLELYKCNNIPNIVNENVKELNIIDCELENLNQFHLENLEMLIIENKIFNDQIKQQMYNIEIFSKLKYIRIDNQCIETKNIEILKQLQQAVLLNFNNITVLNSDSIKELRLNECKIQSLDVFNLPNLEVLNIGDSQNYVNKLYSIQNIAKFSQLKQLQIYGYNYFDIRPLSQLLKLKTLSLHMCNQITLKLTSDSLSELFINDVNSISQSDLNLEMKLLNLEVLVIEYKFNRISFKIDGFYKLQQLIISGCTVDITPLQQFKLLTKLQLKSCSVCNIDVLRRLTNLEELNLSENQIVYIDPLEQLTKLTSLVLSNNFIHDFSAICRHSNFKNYVIDGQQQALSKQLKKASIMQNLNKPIIQLNQIHIVGLKKRINNRKEVVNKCVNEIFNNQISFTNRIAQLFQLFLSGDNIQ